MDEHWERTAPTDYGETRSFNDSRRMDPCLEQMGPDNTDGTLAEIHEPSNALYSSIGGDDATTSAQGSIPNELIDDIVATYRSVPESNLRPSTIATQVALCGAPLCDPSHYDGNVSMEVAAAAEAATGPSAGGAPVEIPFAGPCYADSLQLQAPRNILVAGRSNYPISHNASQLLHDATPTKQVNPALPTRNCATAEASLTHAPNESDEATPIEKKRRKSTPAPMSTVGETTPVPPPGTSSRTSSGVVPCAKNEMAIAAATAESKSSLFKVINEAAKEPAKNDDTMSRHQVSSIGINEAKRPEQQKPKAASHPAANHSHSEANKNSPESNKKRKNPAKQPKALLGKKDQEAAMQVLVGKTDLLQVLPQNDCIFLGKEMWIFTLQQLKYVLDNGAACQALEEKLTQLRHPTIANREQNPPTQLDPHSMNSSSGSASKLQSWRELIKNWKDRNVAKPDPLNCFPLNGPLSCLFPPGTFNFILSTHCKTAYDFLSLKKTELSFLVDLFISWQQECGIAATSTRPAVSKHLVGIATRIGLILGDTMPSLKNEKSWLGFGGMVILRGAFKDFVLDYCRIFSASKFLDTKTKVLAEMLNEWRRQQQPPKQALKGSGNVAMVSAWKAQLKEELDLEKLQGKIVDLDVSTNAITSLLAQQPPRLPKPKRQKMEVPTSQPTKVKKSRGLDMSSLSPATVDAIHSPVFMLSLFGADKVAVFSSVGIHTAAEFLDSTKSPDSDLTKALIEMKSKGSEKSVQAASCTRLLYIWQDMIKEKIKLLESNGLTLVPGMKKSGPPRKKECSDNPFDMLSLTAKEFLATIDILTAESFLSTPTKHIANKFLLWRQQRNMAPLKGHGNVATISAMKTKVRDRAAELGFVSLSLLKRPSYGLNSTKSDSILHTKANIADARDCGILSGKTMQSFFVSSDLHGCIFHFELQVRECSLSSKSHLYLTYLGSYERASATSRAQCSKCPNRKLQILEDCQCTHPDPMSGTIPFHSACHGLVELSHQGVKLPLFQEDVFKSTTEKVTPLGKDLMIDESVIVSMETNLPLSNQGTSSHNVFELIDHNHTGYYLFLPSPIEKGQSVKLNFLRNCKPVKSELAIPDTEGQAATPKEVELPQEMILTHQARCMCHPTPSPFFFGLIWPILLDAGWRIVAGDHPSNIVFFPPANILPNHAKTGFLQECLRLSGNANRIGLGRLSKLTKRLCITCCSLEGDNAYNDKVQGNSLAVEGGSYGCLTREVVEAFEISLYNQLEKRNACNAACKEKVKTIIEDILSFFAEFAPFTFYDEDNLHLEAKKHRSDVLGCHHLVRMLLVLPSLLQESIDITIDQRNQALPIIRELLDFVAKNHNEFLGASFQLTKEEYDLEPDFQCTLITSMINTMAASDESGSCLNLPGPLKESQEVVLPEDQAVLTDFVTLVMSQTIIGQATQVDAKRKNRRIRIGEPGIFCRHCLGQNGAGKYFYGSNESISTAATVIEKHLLGCPSVDITLKHKIADARSNHSLQLKGLPSGAQGAYFTRLFQRMNAIKQSVASVGSEGLDLLAFESSTGTMGQPSVENGSQDDGTDLPPDVNRGFTSHLDVMHYIQKEEPWKSMKSLSDAVEKYYKCLEYGGSVVGTEAMPPHFSSEWLYSKVCSKT